MDHIAADDDFMKYNAPQAFFYSKTILTLIPKQITEKNGKSKFSIIELLLLVCKSRIGKAMGLDTLHFNIFRGCSIILAQKEN
jgi:hypothetical protein